MFADAVRTGYAYDAWATERVLDAAAGLTSEQFLAPAPAQQRSVRDALVHVLSAQRGWLSWWDGSLPPAEAYALKLDPADHPDLASVRARWAEVERQTQAFVSGLSDADMERVYSMQAPNGEWRMRLWQMMLHVANHGTQHRSEVAMMLTGCGCSPGDLDLLYYIAAH